jgi:ERCC4-related helicase
MDSVQRRPDQQNADPAQEHIVEMTGATSPDRRAELWEMPDKRLFFMTPGTLKNDLAKGAQAAAQLVI